MTVDDTRLRNFNSAFLGTLGYANPTRSILMDNGEILRIRTLSDNTLDIRYCSPNYAITFSANTITADAMARSGVDLAQDGANIYCFWVDSDGVTIKTATSGDYGHTWSAASTVATVPAQGTGITVQLTAPSKDILFYTDSTVQYSGKAQQTGLYVTVRFSGTWQTPIFWQLAGQLMGVKPEITLPDGTDYPSNLSSVMLNDSTVILSYYGDEFREVFTTSLYTQQVANLDLSTGLQHLHWAHPQAYLPTIGIDDDNQTSQIAMIFPRLQRVAAEYWMIALEVSEFVGHQRYHLGFIRSSDAKHFQDRQYNQGASNDEQEGAYVYDGGSPFRLTDLIYANLIVTDTYTFIVGFDNVFWCPSTTLVGVTNPERQLDLTDSVAEWTLSQGSAPSGATANYTLGSVPKNWNEQDLLAAHRGIRILHKAGYFTDIEHGDELLDVGQFWIDSITQHVEIGVENGTVQAIDNTMLLDRWKSDVYWNYRGAEQIAVNTICDLIPFIIIQGSMTLSGSGVMRSGDVKPRDNFLDDVAVLNTEQANDGGFVICRFTCDKTWDNNHVGIDFQGQEVGDANDNKRWWGVYYNHPRSTGKFSLVETVPVNKQNAAQLYRFRPPVQESSDITLNHHQNYWLKVGVWHGHVMAWYTLDSTDADGKRVPNPNWIEVINYESPASPDTAVIPARIGWQGVTGTQRTTPSGAIGVLATDGTQQSLADGSGNPIMYATRVQLGDSSSVLRSINVVITQENTGQTPMPDSNVILGSGDDTSPDDLTNAENVLFAKDASALHFSAHDSPNWVGFNAAQNPTSLRFQGEEYVWVVATFNAPLVAGQSYKVATNAAGTGLSMVSTDGGATWSAAPAVMTASVQVEYLNGVVRFSKVWYGAGDNVKTYEELAHQIAAKSGILNVTTFDWLAQSKMTVGADTFLWQPTSNGTIGDLVLDCDYTISSSPLRVFVGAGAIGVGDSDCFIVSLDADAQTISTYGIGNVLVETESSLQYIPTTAHLQVVVQQQFIYVYLNECLAYVGYNYNFSTVGYVGVDPNGVTFTNLRIPDLYQVVDYFDIQANESAMSALQRLIATPAPGTTARVKFFVRYDGSLEIGSFSRRSVVDTYENTILSADKTQTGQYVASAIAATGNYYSRRTQPKTLDTDGYWFDQRQVTDGRTDANAYAATEGEFRDAREKGVTPSITNLPDWALEREDLDFIINPQDHTSGYYIVNSNEWSYTPESSGGQVTQTTTYRTFEGEIEE